MNLEVFLSLLGTILGFMISVFTLILKLSKNKKIRKTAEQMLRITDEISRLMIEAEQFKNYTGEEKKNYVLTKINQYSIENRIPFSSDTISEKLEEMIELTKNVNAEEKRKDWL